ncbi:hypothetical protein AHF37_09358 [Paragonimus kellicotti]|nr:hypothetical protein AHF37_09358 [Paragonimus kellicotti]
MLVGWLVGVRDTEGCTREKPATPNASKGVVRIDSVFMGDMYISMVDLITIAMLKSGTNYPVTSHNNTNCQIAQSPVKTGASVFVIKYPSFSMNSTKHRIFKSRTKTDRSTCLTDAVKRPL